MKKKTPQEKAPPEPESGLKPANPKYQSVLETLFSEDAARHAFTHFANLHALATAYSPDKATNLWRAWREARTSLANDRPLDSFQALKESASDFPLDFDSAELAEAERLTHLSECLQLGNQLVEAARYTDLARQNLVRFVQRAAVDPLACAAEITTMLRVLCSTDLPKPAQDDGLLAAWVVTRGLDLLCNLARRASQLPLLNTGPQTAPSDQLTADAREFGHSTHIPMDSRINAKLRLVLGDILSKTDPEAALAHFDYVTQHLSETDGLALEASGNAANCLLVLGRYDEAEFRFTGLNSLFEMGRNWTETAQTWMCISLANWYRRRNSDILPALLGAIRMFEDSIPAEADVHTRYSRKRLFEPGYKLLVTVLAHSEDRSEAMLDLLLTGVWTLLSRDALANLKGKDSSTVWQKMVDRARRPLAAMKRALRPLTSVGVLHLLAGIDSVIWIVFGYDSSGTFRLECAPQSAESAHKIESFLNLMNEGLEADRQDDALEQARVELELGKAGAELADGFPQPFRALLLSFSALIYAPHPGGNLDEFPVGGLFFNGESLAEKVTIVRSPGVMHLREMLSPNRADVRPNAAGIAILGSAEAGGEILREMDKESQRVVHMLNVLGFNAASHTDVDTHQMEVWLDGSAGALHYIGHGIANEVYEALPLSNGEEFAPINADHLDGFRVPFLFFCSCVAARIRYGHGGYQTGLVSKLCERGAPAAVAFTTPVTERAAYALAGEFYRAANKLPFGEAVRQVFRASRGKIPDYARLSFTPYGDPAFFLPAMASGSTVPMIHHQCARWDSLLRNHCVLRTKESSALLDKSIHQAPQQARELLQKCLAAAFQSTPSENEEIFDALEQIALDLPESFDVERLSLRAMVCAERLHQSGIETIPINISTAPVSIRRLFECAQFLAFSGASLFDTRLNGLGNSLLGRILTLDQNDATAGALYLRQGSEKLLECETQSPFAKSLRTGNEKILAFYGLDV